jgi:hypothetical protein
MVTSHQVQVSNLKPSTTYHYSAQSTDSNNNSASSPDATFTTPADQLTVAVASPASGATVSSTISVSASVSDQQQVAISSVQFQLDGANVGSPVTSAPYSYSWNTTAASNGTHKLDAIATDAAGTTVTSSSVSVTVKNGSSNPAPPTISISAPAGGASVSGTVSVTASASSTVGIASVQFQLDGANVGSADTTSPYTYSWNTVGVSNGNHILDAIATDTNGNSTTSAGVSVTVNNVAPTVSITSPASGATVSGTVTVTATASSSVGIASVQFQLDGTNVGSADTTSPYTYSWSTTGSTNGSHTLKAVATDKNGNSATSAGVTVTVNNVAAPTVSITSPASGATVSGTVTVTATASSSVGIASVQFQLDGTNVGSADTTSPYTYSWSTTGSTNGSHTLKAVAKDKNGNSATSAGVTVTVNNASGPTVSITAPASGATVSGTVTVTATASSSVGIASVQFQLDGANVGSADTTSPYNYSWSTTGSTNGSHTLKALATDKNNNTATSTGVTVTVSNSSSGPTVPTGLTATAVSSSQINLSWNASTDPAGVTGYHVYREGTQVGTSAGTSYSDAGLSASTTYSYTVAAYDAAGHVSAQSSPASTTTLAAPANGLPQDQLPTGTGWHDLGGTTKLSTSNACTSGIGGNEPCEAILSAWSGMAADTNDGYAVAFGGGHSDSCNNQVLALNLTGSSGWTWQAITQATTPSCGSQSYDCLPDTVSACPSVGSTGFPQSVHSYSVNSWDPTRRWLYTAFGSKATDGYSSSTAWAFNMGNTTWTTIGNSSTGLMGNCSGATSEGLGGVAAYDLYWDKYIVNSVGCLYAIDPNTNIATQLTNSAASYILDDLDGVIDPVRHLLVYMGDSNSCGSNSYCGILTDNITPGGSYARTNLTSVMGANGCSALMAPGYPSMTYDPVTTLILAAERDITQGVWYVNVSSQPVLTAYGTVAAQSCMQLTSLGSGPPASDAGVSGGSAWVGHGKLQYQAFCDCFAYINNWDQDAWILRLSRLPADQQAFVQRSAGPNVVRAIGMNNASDLTNGGDGLYDGYADDAAAGYAPVLDTSTAGSVGDILFHIPAQGNGNASGSVRYNFSPGPAFSTQFGIGSEFWLSYRINYDQFYATHTYAVVGGGSVSPKVAIVGNGQQQNYTLLETASCSLLEQVIQPSTSLGANQFPQTYGACGYYVGKVVPSQGADFDLEPGFNNQCRYSGTVDCFNETNHWGKWVNVLYHIKVNEWSGAGTKGTSKFEVWMGEEGGSLNLITSTSDEGFSPDNQTTDPYGSNMFGKIWLLPYMTQRDNTVNAGQDTYIRYDKFIVSTSYIPVAGPVKGVPAMGPPTLIKVANGGSSANLTWHHNELQGNVSYLVERCAGNPGNCWQNPTANFTQIANAGYASEICTNMSSCSFTDSTVVGGTQYTYRVRAMKVLYGVTYYSEYTGGLGYLGDVTVADCTAKF